MKITQVTFIAKNKKCVSLGIKRYLIITDSEIEALEKANELLKKDKNFDLYIALPTLPVEAHAIEGKL